MRKAGIAVEDEHRMWNQVMATKWKWQAHSCRMWSVPTASLDSRHSPIRSYHLCSKDSPWAAGQLLRNQEMARSLMRSWERSCAVLRDSWEDYASAFCHHFLSRCHFSPLLILALWCFDSQSDSCCNSTITFALTLHETFKISKNTHCWNDRQWVGVYVVHCLFGCIIVNQCTLCWGK